LGSPVSSINKTGRLDITEILLKMALNTIIPTVLLSLYLRIQITSQQDLFILKNMGAAIIDFRVCPPLVKCKNLMFSGFIDTLMYGFSSIVLRFRVIVFNSTFNNISVMSWRYVWNGKQS
jgi:hypothetical protein